MKSHTRTELIDCHCHLLDLLELHVDSASNVIEEAKSKNVKTIILVAQNLEESRKAIDLYTKHPNVKLCIGQHPAYVDSAEWTELRALIERNATELCGIGECGLDFTPHCLRQCATRLNCDEAEVKRLQREALTWQCELANKFSLTLNVHSRGAGHHTIELLEQSDVRRALFHAFDGKAKYATACVQKNSENFERYYAFSVPCSVQRSPQFAKLVAFLPLSALVLESDAPALPAVKDTLNKPAYIVDTVNVIADIKKESGADIARATTLNAKRLFSL